MSPLKFGCRLLATMNVNPEDKKHLLLTGPRSLKVQSTQPVNTSGLMQEDSFHPLARKAQNTDGFGAVILDDQTHHQTRLSISQSDKLPDILKRLSQGMSGLFHIRFATVGDVSDSNSHPYLFQDVSLVQNGTLDSARRDGFLYSQEAVSTINRVLPQVTLRDQDSDSRRFFYYWHAYLKQRHPHTPPSKLTTDEIKRSFTHIQNQILATRPANRLALKPDAQVPVTGTLDFSHKINSIIGLGTDRILGLRHGRDLHLGYQTNTQGQMTRAILATEPQLYSPYKWITIPDNHWISLTKRDNHTIDAQLSPAT
jgi:hypothetical protein